jgi:hypothetical protein
MPERQAPADRPDDEVEPHTLARPLAHDKAEYDDEREYVDAGQGLQGPLVHGQKRDDQDCRDAHSYSDDDVFAVVAPMVLSVTVCHLPLQLTTNLIF